MSTLLYNSGFQISLSIVVGIIAGVSKYSLSILIAYLLFYEYAYFGITCSLSYQDFNKYLQQRLIVLAAALAGFWLGRIARQREHHSSPVSVLEIGDERRQPGATYEDPWKQDETQD